MITKTLQKKIWKKKNSTCLGEQGLMKNKKGGGVKPNFTPSSPIFFKTLQELPRNPRDLHCWRKSKLFLRIYLNFSCFPFIPLTKVPSLSIFTSSLWYLVLYLLFSWQYLWGKLCGSMGWMLWLRDAMDGSRPRIFFINGFLCFLEDEW